MKYLLLLVVVVGVLAWLSASRRGRMGGEGRAAERAAKRPQTAVMLACAHCGVHLPKSEALFDAGGRPYCGEAHRLAGPR